MGNDDTIYKTKKSESVEDVLEVVGAAIALMLKGIGHANASGFAIVLFDPMKKDEAHGFMTNVVDQPALVRVLRSAADLREKAPPP